MEWCRFARYTIQQYLPLIKDLSDEELLQLISILNIPILMNGLKSENLKEMSIDNHSTSTSVLWSATSLCEDLKREIKKHGGNGPNSFKSVKLLANLIFFLRETQIKIIQKHTKRTV